MKRFHTFVLAICLLVPATALADSIHLKSGRVIRTDWARIEGDRVVFWQLGGYQSLPMELVDRIETDTWDGPGPPPPRPGASALPQPGTASDAPTASTDTGTATPNPAEALRALSTMIPEAGSGVDTGQALQLLQGLAGAEGGLDSLGPLLGMLGGMGGLAGTGGAGGGASELGQIQTVLPALSRLASALFAEQYSEEATEAATRDLIKSLESMGISRAEIRARAQQLGVPAEILDRIRTP